MERYSSTKGHPASQGARGDGRGARRNVRADHPGETELRYFFNDYPSLQSLMVYINLRLYGAQSTLVKMIKICNIVICICTWTVLF